MAFHKFFDLLLMVYITTLHILQRVSIFHSIISMIIIEGQKQGLPIGLESIKTNSKLSPVSPARSSPGKSSPTKTSSNPVRKSRRQTLDDDDDLGEGNLDYSNLENNQWALKIDELAEGTAYGSFILDSAGMLASACDLVHVRCAKLIGARSDQHSMLNPSDFYRFYATTWQFVNAAESVTGRICFGLKGAILSQVCFVF
jgi:vacuolar protein sorting-associated protein 54